MRKMSRRVLHCHLSADPGTTAEQFRNRGKAKTSKLLHQLRFYSFFSIFYLLFFENPQANFPREVITYKKGEFMAGQWKRRGYERRGVIKGQLHPWRTSPRADFITPRNCERKKSREVATLKGFSGDFQMKHVRPESDSTKCPVLRVIWRQSNNTHGLFPGFRSERNFNATSRFSVLWKVEDSMFSFSKNLEKQPGKF